MSFNLVQPGSILCLMNESHVSITRDTTNNENNLSTPTEGTTNVCQMCGNEKTPRYHETMDQVLY